MQQNGWELPPETYVAPHVLPDGVLASRLAAPQQSSKIREIVFFGRLEVRKGLKLFCDAVDELCADPVPYDFEVSFLGKETLIYGRSSISYISDRSKQWSIP
jgi:O-antigen biosynthesis protein